MRVMCRRRLMQRHQLEYTDACLSRSRRCAIACWSRAALVLSSARSRPTSSGFGSANVGLPAVDLGVAWTTSRSAGVREPTAPSRATAIAASIASAAAGTRYARGPRHREVPRRRRRPRALSAVADASRSAAMTTAAVVRRLRHRPHRRRPRMPKRWRAALRRAARRRVRAGRLPRSTRCSCRTIRCTRQLQWNLPLINLERAWDIQPQAGSTHHRRRARHRHRLPERDAHREHSGVHRRRRRAVSGARPRDDPVLRGAAAGRRRAPAASSRRTISSGTTTTPLDFDGHGTHVSGTIGQLTNDGIGTAGVAFNVKLMPVKVIDSVWDVLFGAPNRGRPTMTVARGIRYAADNGAKIINMSIGRDRPAGLGAGRSRPRSATPSARASSSRSPAATSSRTGNPTRGDRRDRVARRRARCRSRPSIATKAHAFYSSTGSYVELAAPGGSERGFGRDGFVFQQTFDFNFTDTFLLPPVAVSARRGSTCSATSATSARRWRRRTSPASRRC